MSERSELARAGMGNQTRGQRFLHFVALSLCAFFIACGSESSTDRTTGQKRPDVVLITIDTLRADRLGAYGSDLDTPHIDALATEGLVFENAVAPLPETRPSHFTLLTGQYPRTHGVTSNAFSLSPDALTLAEIFSDAGYRTAAFVGCALLGPGSGAEQGFDVLGSPNRPQRPAQEVVAEALEWIDAEDANPEQPIFLWVHLFDPHMPYEPPGAENLGSEDVEGDSRGLKHFPTFSWPRLRETARRNDGNLPRWALNRALSLYDGEVEHVDEQLGVLFDTLRRRPNWDQSVTLLTADHGECFAKGVYFDHSFCLDEGALAVPMILRAPGLSGRREGLVEHLDVGPTLLDLAGLERPSSFAGQGLLQPRADRRKAARTAFFQHPLYRDLDITNRNDVFDDLRSVAQDPTRRIHVESLQIGLRRGSWKYLRRGDGEELYHLSRDPREKRDRSTLNEAKTRELRNVLRRWLKEHPVHETGSEDLSPELVQQLKDLGYL